MYQNKLLDAYKKAQNYIQDKQIAHDLNLDAPKISKIRKGIRQLTDNEAVFLAQGAKIDPEIALLGCHADRNENPMIKEIWENIAKKFNHQGLQQLSVTVIGFLGVFSGSEESLYECALCILC